MVRNNSLRKDSQGDMSGMREFFDFSTNRRATSSQCLAQDPGNAQLVQGNSIDVKDKERLRIWNPKMILQRILDTLSRLAGCVEVKGDTNGREYSCDK
jgi:hypothetical protein